MYEQLFTRIYNHPQNTRLGTHDQTHEIAQMRLLEPYISEETTVMVIGCGDGGLSRLLAEKVRSVLAIDVTDKLFDRRPLPANMKYALTNGIEICGPRRPQLHELNIGQTSLHLKATSVWLSP